MVPAGFGAAAPPLLISNRVSRTEGVEKGTVEPLEKPPREGSSRTGFCPRQGTVYLHAIGGGRVEMPTNCKTWRCDGCKRRLISLFKARIETGCSILGRSSLITVTYQSDRATRSAAEYVNVDWKALFRLMKRKDPTLIPKWFRVMELTKKGTPHHHLVTSTTGRERCYGQPFDMRLFKRRFDYCDCTSHRWSRLWYEVTKDSYLVHAMPTKSAAGAARYLAKYLTKTFGEENRWQKLGMQRRFSTSKWPGSGQLKLKYSDWTLIMHGARHGPEETATDAYLLERTGTDVALALKERRVRKSQRGEIRRLICAE